MNRYRTNHAIVEAIARTRSSMVVIFIVNVRLVERNVKSQAGKVKVRKPMVWYSRSGTTVNMPSKRLPIVASTFWGVAVEFAGGVKVARFASEVNVEEDCARLARRASADISGSN